ncbi:type VI secretion system-associated FHA domain protein [Vibrio owensii]|uniref:type VI secretion system-associated FHA domain protein n=1 Tax=Vibrio owensii TaxID=696485 RepID=UPI0005EE9CE5|nr:type VI secretion system-associated FHA domain protein [Vibrio owensii]NOI71659.1 FHA domain-containing protein [Vibrio owensii]
MAISIHLISVPSEEVVTSRVIYLPESGGQFGRSASCEVALPDQSKRISRIHGQIRLTDTGYLVKSTGKNPARLNDKAMVRDKDYPLNDGDILKIESYSMLVSTLTSSKAPVEEQSDDLFATKFDLQLEDNVDFLDEGDIVEPVKSEVHYSHQNVMSDDPFSSDPFEDIDDDELADHFEVDEVSKQQQAMERSTEIEYLPGDHLPTSELEASIEKLITITEKNQQYLRNPPLAHDALFDALDKTLEQFLNEFAPNQLENQFSEFVSGGLFSSKDKKYWKIYRKHFQHRQDNGDFRRQFKAMFMENMQKQSEES